MSLADALIADFAHDAPKTRTYLLATPEDRFDWRPHEKSMSLRRLAGHIAEMPQWIHATLDDELDFAGAGAYQPFRPATTAELVEGFDANAAAFEDKLAGVADEHLFGTWTMRRGDQILARMPRLAAIRGFILTHIVHHRGQLSVYLRLLDVPLPQVMGPTADNPSF